MSKQLAADEITITIDSKTVIYLRPSLRAAMRLERAHGGFDKLVSAVLDGNLGVMASIIRESAIDPSHVPDLIEEIGLRPLQIGLGQLTGPLLAHVYALTGIDPNEPASVEEAAPSRMDWADHHTRLFEIGVGWLGLSPSDTWNSTPSEIMAGYRGRIEMLKAVFGGSDDKPDTSGLDLDDKMKLTMASFPTKIVKRSSKGRAANAA